jgi:Fe-S oxidoreductase
MWLINAWLNQEIQPSQRFAEILFSCVACANCQEYCVYPFKDDLLAVFEETKTALVNGGLAPPAVRDYFKAIHVNGNPYKLPQEQRGRWAEGTGLEEFSGQEYLFYVGCVGSYDEIGMRMARSVGLMLKEAGYSIGYLGSRETCDGNEVKVLGETGLFSLLAEENIRKFREMGVKKVITLDPHALNVFRKEYPKLGADFQVWHFTEVLGQAVKQGRIVPSPYRVRVTYHDPCYLGRHNRIFKPPRSVLKRIPDLEVVEMRRSKEDSFCCGGGGGNFFTDILGGGEDSPNRVRIREAADTGAELLAVTCPTCAKMLTDALKAEDLQGRMEVVDLAEILRRAGVGC